MRERAAEKRRDISVMHQDVIKTDICLDLQNSDLSNFGRKLYEDANKLQEKRHLVFLRSIVVWDSESSNVESLMKLPFLQSETVTPFERMVEVPGLEKWKNMFQKFLEGLLRIRDLPMLLSKFQDYAFMTGVPFIPQGMRPVQFMAGSTLPALFGFCWSLEFQVSYCRFLAEIARNLKFGIAQFRKHWIVECYRSYILSASMSKYVRCVFQSTITTLLDLCLAPDFAFSQSFLEEIICSMADLITTLTKLLPSMPRDVRFLLKALFESAENEEDGLDRVSTVVCNCILLPVYRNPKVFGVIGDTLQMHPCSHITLIGKMWSYIRHPDLKDPEFQEFDLSRLQSLHFSAFLKELINVDENLNAPSMVPWMDHCEVSNILLLLSVTDISLLAFLITSTGLGGGNVLELAKSILEISNRVDFRLFRYESWILRPYNIPTPGPQEPKWNRNALVEHNEGARLFCKLLSVAPQRPDEPADVDAFLKFVENMANVDHDVMTRTILSDLVNEMKDAQSGKAEILEQIRHEIKERKTHITTNYDRIIVAKELEDQIASLAQQADTRTQELFSIIRGHLVLSFFDGHENISRLIEDFKEKLSLQRNLFRPFFIKCCTQFETFATPIAPYLVQSALPHLHSHILKRLPLKEFVMAHPRFLEYDQNFVDVSSMRILEICGPLHRFDNDYFLRAATRELKLARQVELPIEAVKCLVRVIHALKDSIAFVGESDDKIHTLFLHMLLLTPIDQIYSFSRYLEFFLVELKYKDRSLLSDEENRVLRFVIELLSVCDRLLLNHFTLLPQL